MTKEIKSKVMLLGVFTTLMIVITMFMNKEANAVTYGREETQASSSFPWVVPIFYFEKESDKPSSLCTGTLISQNVVLTAAHCIPEEGRFEVKYGITSLEEESNVYQVDGAWVHPRYSKSRFGTNDIGLLRLKTPIIGAATLPLTTSFNMKAAEKAKEMKILGWGEDQNGNIATYLRSAKVVNQSQLLKKLVGSKFNADLWLAAGLYNKTEKVYAGGCHGDSGGPLVALVKNSYVQVGITSFGASYCETQVPTIFMKISYYEKEIKAAIKQLGLNALTNDRSAPELITAPSIVALDKSKGLLKCDSGSWTPNVKQLEYEWFVGEDIYSKESGENYTLTDYDFGKSIRCVVRAESKSGFAVSEAKISIPAKPVIVEEASIIGMPASSYEVKTQNSVSCNLPKIQGDAQFVSYYWYLRNAASGSQATLYSQESKLNLPISFFTENANRVLFCGVQYQGEYTSLISWASRSIYLPQKPNTPSVSIAGFTSYGSNSDAYLNLPISCKLNYALPENSYESLVYSWYIFEQSAGYSPTSTQNSQLISQGQNLILTQAILDRAVLKRIGCIATVRNGAGESVGFSSSVYIDYRNMIQADTTAPVISIISLLPNRPLLANEYFGLTFTATDESGFDSSAYGSFTFRLIGPDNREVSSVGNPLYKISGDSKSAKFLMDFRTPVGALSGTYKILMSSCDIKSNCNNLVQVGQVTLSADGGLARITSTVLSGVSDNVALKEGDVAVCTIAVSNNYYKSVTYLWTWGSSSEGGSYSEESGFKSETVNSLTSTFTITAQAIAASKGKYFVCQPRLNGPAESPGWISFSQARVKVPA